MPFIVACGMLDVMWKYCWRFLFCCAMWARSRCSFRYRYRISCWWNDLPIVFLLYLLFVARVFFVTSAIRFEFRHADKTGPAYLHVVFPFDDHLLSVMMDVFLFPDSHWRFIRNLRICMYIHFLYVGSYNSVSSKVFRTSNCLHLLFLFSWGECPMFPMFWCLSF